MSNVKIVVTALVATLVLALSAFAGSASSAQNVQDGLVNVAVFDVTVIDGDVVLVLNEILSRKTSTSVSRRKSLRTSAA